MTDWKAQHRRHMRGFVVGFLLAAAAGGLSAFIDYGPRNPWAYFVMALVITGLGICGYHGDRARAIAFAELRRMDREAAERRAARRRALESASRGEHGS
jgi:hypothetical protein